MKIINPDTGKPYRTDKDGNPIVEVKSGQVENDTVQIRFNASEQGDVKCKPVKSPDDTPPRQQNTPEWGVLSTRNYRA